MKRVLALLMSVCMMALAGCGASEKAEKIDDSKPTVYASFYPIYNLVEEIAGDKVNIVSFMPQDKEAHHWEPSTRDIKELNGADVMFINGAGMEPWIGNVEKSAPEVKIYNLSKDMDLIKAGTVAKKGEFNYMAEMDLKKDSYKIDFGHTHEKLLRVGFYKLDGDADKKKLEEEGKKIMAKDGKEEKHDSELTVENGEVYNLEMAHEHSALTFNIPEEGKWVVFADRVSGDALPYTFLDKDGKELKLEELEKKESDGDVSYDPHSWLSLKNARIYTNRITKELSKISPENKEFFEKNKEAYQEKLKALDDEYKEKFKTTRIKEFVVPHEAFGYICRDYGLKQFPLQGLTSMEEPSLKTIQEAIDFCKKSGIKTVFYEYGGSSKGAEAIAKEIGGKIEPLSTMEFVSPKEEKDKQGYFNLMKMDLENIYQSLQ